HPLPGKFVARNHQKVRPLIGPVVHEFWPLDESGNQLVSLVRRVILQECLHLGGSGQDTGRVKISAANKFRVRSLAGWWDMKLFKVGRDQIVDVVVPRKTLEGRLLYLVGERNAHTRKGYMTLVPDRDRRFAGAPHGDFSAGIHISHAIIAT